ncbi:MAG TPA: 50S ribosomal protein L13 [Clostridiales bacterium]|nr:50S ribosomal protein L13 [Clostridiales bacterium]
MRTTYMACPADIKREWYVVDASDRPLGRLASQVAAVLRGKHKPTFTPFLDTGDHVIVVNAEKVALTGRKLDQKFHFRHSGYPGGARFTSYRRLLAEHPDRVIELAVRGMLPHNRLGRAMARKLKVYRGPVHPHEAQKPQPLGG